MIPAGENAAVKGLASRLKLPCVPYMFQMGRLQQIFRHRSFLPDRERYDHLCDKQGGR